MPMPRKVLFSIAVVQFFLVSAHLILEVRSVYIVVENNKKGIQADAAVAVVAVGARHGYIS